MIFILSDFLNGLCKHILDKKERGKACQGKLSPFYNKGAFNNYELIFE